MRLIIEIDLDGAAFDTPGPELAKMLRREADTISCAVYRADLTFLYPEDDRIIDSNGNPCGTVRIEET